MPDKHSAFGASQQQPKVIKDVVVDSVELKVGETYHAVEAVHVLGLSPNYKTVTPAKFDGDRVRDYEWEPNSIGYLPPGVQVQAAVLEASRATFVAIPDRIFKQAAYETFDTSRIDFRWMPNVIDPISTDLIGALSKLKKSVDGNDFPIVSESIATALAVRMMQQIGAEARSGDVPDGSLPKHVLRLVLDYIETNLHNKIRLSELAGVATLSMFHFARSFRQAMNIAPVRYIWHRRIERAKLSLRNKATPLVVVSIDCGYSSQSHFTTAFKEATGLTPAAFRAALLGWLAWEMLDLAELCELAELAA